MKKKITSTILSMTMLVSSMTGCKTTATDSSSSSVSESKTSSSSVSESKSSSEVQVAQLSTPANVTLSGKVVSWKAVDNAKSYVVYVGDSEYTVTSNSFDLSSIDVADGTTIKIKAIADNYKDSENSLSVKYEDTEKEAEKEDNRVNLLINLISENTSIDLSNPLTLVKYQEPLQAITRTITTYNVSQEDLTKIAEFAKDVMEELSNLAYQGEISYDPETGEYSSEIIEEPDVVGILLSVANKYVEADLNSTVTLSLAKDLVAIMIINDVSETMQPNNGYAIKLNKVASYLCSMQDADVAKVAKILDFGTNTYKSVASKLATMDEIDSLDDYIAIKDYYVAAVKANLPSYTEAKEIGTAICNILNPFETESKALKRVVDYEIYTEYQNIDFALYVASNIDAEFVGGLYNYAMGIVSTIGGLSSYGYTEDFEFDFVKFVLDYAGVDFENEQYETIYEGLTNLFYNLDEILFVYNEEEVEYDEPIYYEEIDEEKEKYIEEEYGEGEDVIIGDEPYYPEEPAYYNVELNPELVELIFTDTMKAYNGVLSTIGLNMDNLSTFIATVYGVAANYAECEDLVQVATLLQDVYDNAQLTSVLPFVEGKDMNDLVTLLAQDVSPVAMAALQECENFDDVVAALGLDDVFEFTNFKTNLKNYIGTDLFENIDTFVQLITDEEKPLSVAGAIDYLVKKLKLAQVVTGSYVDTYNWFNEKFAISEYPTLINLIVAHAKEDLATIKLNIEGINGLVTSKVNYILENYNPAITDEVAEVTIQDIAELEKQFDIVLSTESQLAFSQDFEAACNELVAAIEEKLEAVEELETKYAAFERKFADKTEDEIYAMLLDTENDILDDVQTLIHDTLEISFDVIDCVFDTFDTTKLNALKADYLAILKNDDDLTDEDLEAIEEELDSYIAAFIATPQMISDYNADSVTEMIIGYLEGVRTQYVEVSQAKQVILQDTVAKINQFIANYTEDNNPINDFFAIQAPEGMDAVTSLYDFLIAYSDETYQAAFKNFVKNNYDDVVALARNIANLDDDSVAILDKYYYDSYINVEYNVEKEDYDYVEVITPYVSTMESYIQEKLAAYTAEESFKDFYSCIDSIIQLMQYEVLYSADEVQE